MGLTCVNSHLSLRGLTDPISPPPPRPFKLDGRIFMTICRNPSVWVGKFSFLKSLTIERLAFTEDGDDLITLECAFIAIACLPLLSSLVLRDVTFLRSPNRIPGAQQRLKLGMSDTPRRPRNRRDQRDALRRTPLSIPPHPQERLHKRVSGSSVHYVPRARRPAGRSGPRRLFNLLGWGGPSIRGCSSFDDNLMGLLEAEISPPYHITRSLRELLIEDCENFTGAALRKMVEARRDFAMREENKHLGFACISDVYVGGAGPVLEEEGARWLRGNVRNFNWGTVLSDGDMSVGCS